GRQYRSLEYTRGPRRRNELGRMENGFCYRVDLGDGRVVFVVDPDAAPADGGRRESRADINDRIDLVRCRIDAHERVPIDGWRGGAAVAAPYEHGGYEPCDDDEE